ncbi:tetratricopeptide repeat protein [Glaciecola siphonariae]|uniref:Tetratricopeptide repeat protein n=1 Tax=Glaciecola siphonariae TaxID=521012 RepID=A0ABV9LYT2_9ALTE
MKLKIAIQTNRLARFALVISALLFHLPTSANNENAASLEMLDSLFKQQQYKTVIKNLKQIPTEKRTVEHFRFLIYSHAELDLDDAEKAAELAVKTLPNEPDVYLMHASIMGAQAGESIFSALGYAQRALESLNKAVELAPNDVQYRQALVSFHLNAPSIAGGDTDVAFAQIKMIETLDWVQGKVNLAWFYRSTDKPEQSLSVLQEANQSLPDNIDILYALASHYVSEDDNAKAIEYYHQVADLALVRPIADEAEVMKAYEEARYRQLNAHYQIGRLALKQNIELEQGIEHLQRYLLTVQNPEAIGLLDTSGLPSKDWANLRLSALQLAKGEPSTAKTTFSKVALDKNDDNMQKIYNALKKTLEKTKTK